MCGTRWFHLDWRSAYRDLDRTITNEELDSYIAEAVNQLRSSKKQPNENEIFNLLLEKIEAIAINKEQWTEWLNYLQSATKIETH